MSADHTPREGELLSGILVPEAGLEPWRDHTTIPETGPMVGRAEPTRRTGLRVIPSGTPRTMGDEGIELVTQVGGVPGSAARFLQRPAGSEDWRGRDDPDALSSWRWIGSHGARVGRHVSAAVTPSGVEILCWCATISGPSGSSQLLISRRLPGSSTWTNQVIDTETTWGAAHLPVIVVVGDRVDIYGRTARLGQGDAGLGGGVPVRWSSHDDGATWEWSSIGTTWEGLHFGSWAWTHVAAGGGQVMMLLESLFGSYIQLASRDGGESWVMVHEYDAAPVVSSLIYHEGRFVAVVHTAAPGGYQSRVLTFASAFDHVWPEDAPIIETSMGPNARDPQLPRGWSWVSEVGDLYVGWQPEHDVAPAQLNASTRQFVSRDGGRTWASDGGMWSSAVDPTEETAYTSIATVQGPGYVRVVATTGNNLYTGTLGGWTTRTRPTKIGVQHIPTPAQGALDGQAWWDSTWVGTNTKTPADSGWLLTGSPSLSLMPWGIIVSGSVAASYRRTTSNRSSCVQACVGFNGGSQGQCTILVGIRPASALQASRAIEVSLTDPGGGADYIIQASDYEDGSPLGPPGAIPRGVDFEIIVGVGRDIADFVGDPLGFAAWRLTGGDPAERVFEVLCEHAPLGALAGTPDPQVVVAFRGPGSPYSVRLTHLWTSLQMGAFGLGWGWTAPASLVGGEWSPRPVYVRDGVSVQATGTTLRLDSWLVPYRYRYGVEQALPTVAPTVRRGHLAGPGVTGAYAWRCTRGGMAPRGGLWGIYLDGLTWGEIAVDLRVGAAWVEVATGLLGEPITWTETGLTLTADTAPDLARWYAEDELVDWAVQRPGGGLARVLHSTEGAWSTEGLRAALQVHQGPGPSGPGGALLAPRALVLLYLPGSLAWEGIRIRVSRPWLGESVGTRVMAIGRVRVLGAGWDETRSVVRELGSELAEQAGGGASESRRRPDRRRVELAMTRGIPLDSQVRQRDHGYVRAMRGGPPVGSVSDPAVLDGLLGAAGRRPVVYLPRIPVVGPGSSRTAGVRSLILAGDTGAVYGRYVPEAYRIESATGHAGAREVVRTSVVTIVEEVG